MTAARYVACLAQLDVKVLSNSHPLETPDLMTLVDHLQLPTVHMQLVHQYTLVTGLHYKVFQ